jgi:hypothetical protein
MIFNLTNLLAVTPCETNKSAFRQAVEDALVIFAFTLVSSLIALGADGLSYNALYVPFLSSTLIGIVTYAKARNIALTGTENAPPKE